MKHADGESGHEVLDQVASDFIMPYPFEEGKPLEKEAREAVASRRVVLDHVGLHAEEDVLAGQVLVAVLSLQTLLVQVVVVVEIRRPTPVAQVHKPVGLVVLGALLLLRVNHYISSNERENFGFFSESFDCMRKKMIAKCPRRLLFIGKIRE